MAGSIVQSRETSVGAIAGTTIALAFSSNNAAHNALYVAAHIGDSGSAPTIADSLTNSYSANLDNVPDVDDNNDISHWAAVDSLAGANTVTATFASAPWRMLYIAEITGVQNVAVDAHKGLHQTAPGTGANAVSSGTAATSTTDFLIAVSSQDHNTGNAAAVGSGFTLDKNGWNASGSNQMTAEYQAGVASGTRGATWTAANATDNLTNVFAGFKESVATSTAFAPRRPSFPSRGPLKQNYGPRVLGFKQGLSTAVVSSDMAAAGALTITGAASLASSIGTLAAAGALTITGAALLRATGTIAGAGTLLITGTAALTGTGTLASAGTVLIVGAAAPTAVGTLAAAGTLVINGSATLPSASDIASAGSLTITGGAALTALGTLASAGTVIITGAAAPTAIGTLASTGALTITGAAPLTSVGSLASAGTVVITGASNLTAPSANDMAAAGSIVITSSAALSALGSLAASGALTITGIARLDDGAVVVTTTPGRREKHPDPPTMRLLRNWRLPSQVRGETEDEKRRRRIAQGILPPDPPLEHPTLVEEAHAAAIKARAEDAQRRTQATRLTREVAELRAETEKYRGRAKASDKAKAARTRIEQLDRRIATLHAQEAQRQAAITAEESDIAFLISVLDSID